MGKTKQVVFLDRTERKRQFGVDCGDKLTWKGGTWEPGGDYVKKLVVKNVSKETIKLKYRIPETRFFSMDFPELIILSPGMSVTVDVVFRPIRFETYDDYIEFRIKGKSFFIAICARLSKLNVEVPDSLDFGFCPTKEISYRTFDIKNVGQIDADFTWSINAPFSLTPMNGTIAPGKSCSMAISFHPENASAFVSKAVCNVVGLPPHIFKASGIGKFPNICASESVVDFGHQLAGQNGCRVEKEIILRNQSLVPASFKVIRTNKDVEPAFAFYPIEGKVPENSFVSFRVTYYPTTSGKYSADDFEIVTPGGNTVSVKCTGMCIGPNVSLRRKERPRKPGTSVIGKPNAVQFGNIKVGEGPSTRVVYLTNYSNLPAVYQFQAEQLGFDFEFVDPPQGVIPAGLEKAITIKFCPSAPANYYRRVYCLFRDQMPQFVDLVGTAFDDDVRPQPLLLRHLEAQLKRLAAGVSRMSPEGILALAANGQDPGAWEDGRVPNYPPESNTFPSRSGEAPTGPLYTFSEFFRSVVTDGAEATRGGSGRSLLDKRAHITVSADDVDFGGGSVHKSSDYKVVVVTNHADAKMVCAWRLPVEEEHKDFPPFAVVPEQSDIAAGKSVQFKVYFQPKAKTKYFNTMACVQAYFKTNRTFRLVNDEAFVPPQAVDVLLRGHTFEMGKEQFLPKVDVCIHEPGEEESPGSGQYRKKLEFPACHVGDSVYQTIMLTNKGDTPVQFYFLEDRTGTFSVKPNAGYITCNQFQLVALRYTPPLPATSKLVMDEDGSLTVKSLNNASTFGSGLPSGYYTQHSFQLKCVLNNAADNARVIDLTGIACTPSIQLAGDGTMYFKPTSVGLISERNLEVTNPSRVPMIFKWRIPNRLRDVLLVEPAVALLRGNETLQVRWKFAPRTVGLNRFKIPVSIRSIGDESPLDKTFLTIVAEGTKSAIVFEPQQLKFETVLVGNQVSRDLLIINNSDCDTVFDLQVVCSGCTAKGEEGGSPSASPTPDRSLQHRCTLKFSVNSGTLHARSKLRTVATFWPVVRGEYTFQVICSTRLAVLPEPHARPRPALPDAATSLVLWDPAAALEGEPSPGPVQDQAFRERIKETVISCQVVAAAAYPVVAVEDARSGRVSTDRIWDQLSIRRLNDLLRTPLTAEEVERSSMQGNDDHKEDVTVLERVELRFTPALQGSPAEEISLQLRNTGNLPVDFSFKFPNDREIEVEGWADEGEPTAAELRENNIIDAHLFDVQPRRGSLAANEAMTVRLRYDYSMLEYLGEHDLQVPFRLLNGKQVLLHLCGKTLRPEEALLFLPRPVLDCFPAPLGALAPARQSFALVNPTPHDIVCSVDTDDLQRLCREHHEFPVLRYVGETKLHVPAGETALLPLVFQPLEAVRYRSALVLRYRAAHHRARSLRHEAASPPEAASEPLQTMSVVVEGRGFHPFQDQQAVLEPYENPSLNPPLKQLLAVPGQVGTLSVERLLFGKVPIGGCVRQISVLRNLTAADLRFRWDDSNALVRAGLVRVEPLAGSVPPGGFVTCKFTLHTHHQQEPEIHQALLDCHLEAVALRTRGSKAARKSMLLAKMSFGGRPGAAEEEPPAKTISRVTSIRLRSQPSRNPVNARLSVVGRETEALHHRLHGESSDGEPLDSRSLTPGSLRSLTPESYRTKRASRRISNGSRMSNVGVSRDGSFLLNSPMQSVTPGSRDGSKSRQNFSVKSPGNSTTDLKGNQMQRSQVISVRIEVLLMNLEEYRLSEQGYQQSENWLVPDATPVLGPLVVAPPAPPQRRRSSLASLGSDDNGMYNPTTTGSLVLTNVPTADNKPETASANQHNNNPELITREKALTENILGSLFRNVLGDLSIQKTIAELPFSDVPYFYQLQVEAKQVEKVMCVPEAQEEKSMCEPNKDGQANGERRLSVNSLTAVMGKKPETAAKDQKRKISGANEQASELVEPQSSNASSRVSVLRQKQMVEAKTYKSALQSTEGQVLSEMVLENAVYNIFQEYLHGEFDLLE